MNQEEDLKKFALYDSKLSIDERVLANTYRKYEMIFIQLTIISLLITYSSDRLASFFSFRDEGIVLFIGIFLTFVSTGFGYFFVGKNIILRKYTSRKYARALFDAAAVRKGRFYMCIGYLFFAFAMILFSTLLFPVLKIYYQL